MICFLQKKSNLQYISLERKNISIIPIIIVITILLSSLCSAGEWTQALAHAKQGINHWTTSLALSLTVLN